MTNTPINSTPIIYTQTEHIKTHLHTKEKYAGKFTLLNVENSPTKKKQQITRKKNSLFSFLAQKFFLHHHHTLPPITIVSMSLFIRKYPIRILLHFPNGKPMRKIIKLKWKKSQVALFEKIKTLLENCCSHSIYCFPVFSSFN